MARRGNGLNFRPKFGPSLKIYSGTSYFFFSMQPVARRGNGFNFLPKFGPLLKMQSGTLDFCVFFVNSAGGEKG